MQREEDSPVTPAPLDSTAMADRGECSFEGCTRDHYLGGYCAGHYQQSRRGGPLKPLRTARGGGTRVNVSCPQELRDAALEAAELEGVNENEFWRRAVAARIAATKKGRGKS